MNFNTWMLTLATTLLVWAAIVIATDLASSAIKA